jgi:Mrp family chromosome partitioning ATPase
MLPGGFDLLPMQGRPENAAELLASPNFGRLLDAFDQDYDFLLFDSAPLLVADDAHFLLRFVDTALVVVAQGKCSSAQAARAVARIARKDIFGVVLNRLAN